MKFENIRVYNFENALRGMRNPKNSWHLSDSAYGIGAEEFALKDLVKVATAWETTLPKDEEGNYDNSMYQAIFNYIAQNGCLNVGNNCLEWAYIGPKDLTLAQNLIKGGSEHRKFLRQIMVTVDITAPLYWWKEFDTYKVGTVANSTSTMHKLTSKPITIDCFEVDDFYNVEYPYDAQREDLKHSIDPDFVQMCLIPYLEYLRQEYLRIQDAIKMPHGEVEEVEELENRAKKVWKELVRWLPESWLQTRTVTMNYETLLAIYHQRRHHKLTEWSGCSEEFTTPSFIKFIYSLPYAPDLICFDDDN